MKTRTVVTALAACTALGCSTPQQTAALECGAVGIGGAYALCKMLGGEDDTCAALAGVGGGVGAAACYNYADQLEASRQKLETEENTLAARLEYTSELIAQTEKLNAQMDERRVAVERYAEQVRQKVEQNQLTAQQLSEARAALDKEHDEASRQHARALAALEENRSYQERQRQLLLARQREQEAGLAREAQANAAQLDELEARNARLALAVQAAQSNAQQFALLRERV